MTHPCVEATTNTLESLRAATLNGQCAIHEHFSPSIYFSSNLADDQISITLLPSDNGLLKADIKLQATPKWLTLCIELGTGVFSPGDVLGLVADLRTSDPFSSSAFIRSGPNSDDSDTQLAQDLRFGAEPPVMTVLHQVTANNPLTYLSNMQTLLMPLPKRNLSFEIRDLRLFHIEAAAGLSLRAQTLGGLSV